MKSVLKKVPLVLLLIWPYATRLFEELLAWLSGNTLDTGVIYICGVVFIGILSIIYGILYRAEDVTYELAFWGRLIKLVHIPYYVTTFIGAIVMLPAFLLTILAAFGWFIYLLLFLVCCIYMISSSVYIVRAVWSMKKQGKIPRVKAVLLTIFSFIFVTDIICAIIVFRIASKDKKMKNIEKSC